MCFLSDQVAIPTSSMRCTCSFRTAVICWKLRNTYNCNQRPISHHTAIRYTAKPVGAGLPAMAAIRLYLFPNLTQRHHGQALMPVGASLLAKNVNGNACFLHKRGTCEFFASELAPTQSNRASPAPTFTRFCQQNRYKVVNAGRHCKKPKNGASSVSQTAPNSVSHLYRNAL